MGVFLLTWALAGVSLAADTPVSLLGIPFRITRGELLPVGLALASLYGTVRYYYYGLMLGTSPYRRRRDILDELVVDHTDAGQRGRGKVRMYQGPTRFTTSPSHYDRDLVEKRAEELREAFPKFAQARVEAKVASSPTVDNDGEQYWTHSVSVTIPIRCRVAALIEDLDYTLPVWLNVVALGALLL